MMGEGERERACDPAALPMDMAACVAEYAWARDVVGESGCAVYRLRSKANAPDLFLKHGRGTAADELTDEMVRLRWMAAHLPVPAVIHFVRTADEAWLLMTAIPGRTAYQLLESHSQDGPAIVEALAIFLRRLHAIPVRLCPFNSDHLFRLSHAEARMAAGLVETEDFDEERAGWTAERVWAQMQALLPIAPDPVVTHGDFSLDNILFHDGAVVGCIDMGRVGIADRYQDLAILWHGLGEFGSSLQTALLRHYGITTPDRRKMQFHLMLDEFF